MVAIHSASSNSWVVISLSHAQTRGLGCGGPPQWMPSLCSSWQGWQGGVQAAWQAVGEVGGTSWNSAVFTVSVLDHLSINPFQQGGLSTACPSPKPSSSREHFLKQNLPGTPPGLPGDMGRATVPCPYQSCPCQAPLGTHMSPAGCIHPEQELVLFWKGCLWFPAAPDGSWSSAGWGQKQCLPRSTVVG